MANSNKHFTFSNVPSVKYSRSKFDLSYGHTTSMNVGELIPFHIQEVYPGDSFEEYATFVDRVSSAFLRPVFGNLIRDVRFFFVPNRIIMDDWDVLIANTNKRGAWANSQIVTAPQINASPVTTPTTINRKHVLAYLGGIPVGERIDSGDGTNFHAISQLPARAFAMIYDDWYRDQNFVDPLNMPKGNGDVIIQSTGQPLSNGQISNDVVMASTPNAWCGLVPKVSKRPDYFRSCLPSPQKGDAVTIPVLGYAPVLSSLDTDLNLNLGSGPLVYGRIDDGTNVLKKLSLADGSNSSVVLSQASSSDKSPATYLDTAPDGLISSTRIAPINLYAQLSNVSATDVNSLRFAFQAQKMLEKDAIGGTRLTEMIASHFGVQNLDSRMDRAEFLGGYSSPLNIQQVAQTSQATQDSPLAALGAYSHSTSQGGYSKSFTEHGFIIGVTCIRQVHTYQESIKRFWFKKARYDYYDPLFCHIGYQPVYKKELTFKANDTDVWSYNEYSADLRWNPSRVSGQLSTNAIDSLDIWTFSDNYANAPTMSQQWIEESPEYVDRTLAIPSDSLDQFISDIWIHSSAIRVMPTFSTPGLIDHDTTRG